MTKQYSYKELLALDDISNFSPAEIINILGAMFDNASKANDSALIDKGLKLSQTIQVDNFDALEKSRFHYNVSNGWVYKLHLTTDPNNIEYNNDSLINQIINIRLALSYCDSHNNCFLKSELLVNLGNTFSHLGRCSEAITLWQNAIECNPNFGMAIGNLVYSTMVK